MEKTLTINPSQARIIYPKADVVLKLWLQETFGKEHFTAKITDRIKTWEDAAAEKGLHPIDSLPFKTPTNSSQEATNAFFMLDIIADVLRQGVVLDWTNSSQKKWYAWFNNYKPGSGFSFHGTDYGWTSTHASGGARLCVDTSEKAEYFGKQFLPLFNKFLNPIT